MNSSAMTFSDMERRVHRVNMMTNKGPFVISMPIGRIIHVGFGASGIGVVYLWVEHNLPVEYVDRTFTAFGDGETVKPDMQYVGTAHDQSFSRTWHIYEDVE